MLLARALLGALLCAAVATASHSPSTTISLMSVPVNRTVVITVPSDFVLNFMLPDRFMSDNCTSGTDNMCLYDLSMQNASDSDTITFTRDFDFITVDITIDGDAEVGCAEYVFPSRFLRGSETASTFYTNVVENNDLEFTCDPVFRDEDQTSTNIVWRRSTDPEVECTRANFNDPSSSILLTDQSSRNGVSFTDNSITVANIDESAIGCYFPVFIGQNSTQYAAPPLLFFTARILNERDLSWQVIFGTGASQNYSEIHCEVRSFPRLAVEWFHDSQLVEEDGDRRFDDFVPTSGRNSENPVLLQLHTSTDGLLVFDEVEYNHSGLYRCRVSHPLLPDPLEYEVRLRVKNPLRPVWPSIGIVVVAILTVLFIVFGTLVDNWLEKRKPKQSDDDDGVRPVRLYSVTSTSEADSSNNVHMAVRRVSSARQELLPAQ